CKQGLGGFDVSGSTDRKNTLLRKKLASGAQIIGPGVYDGLSARIADASGFDVLYLSGYGVSASLLAKPDNGFLLASDMQARIKSLTDVLHTPLIADADTGFGNIAETVAAYEAAGACGIQLEDQRVPKICGHIAGREVIDRSMAIANIKTAVSTRKSKDFLIVARTDAREQNGLEEALARGHEFFAAGADVLFVESPESTEEMKIIGSELGHAPLLANMVEGGRTPRLARAELAAMGFNFVIYPVAAMSVAAAGLSRAYRELLQGDVDAERVDFAHLSHLVGFPSD
ncbi:MAG: isocitrate lyase/PEP mutase family protein, partial [Pseudomonadota bacterium]|nr:isocitrate lyase/PEP mutase family protein [Pseudomonadota bacterium]